jgi:hypothetical protein
MANICFVSLKIECRSKRAALKVNAVLTQLKEAADQQRKGFYAGSDRYIFDAAFYVYEKEVSMAYWVKWGYSDEEVIALIKFLNEISPIKSLQLHYEEGGSLEYGEYIYSAGTLSCRELPVSHYPDATDSDSDQEHLQQAFERYGTTREIPFS